MSIVVDASMTIAWLFEDERTQAAHDALLRVVEAGAVVPSLWRLEIANVLRNAVRKGRCDQDYAQASLSRLSRLPITTDDQTDSLAWGPIRQISIDEGLTPYDAAYLELAVRLAVPLASGDTDLIRAACRRGVELIAI